MERLTILLLSGSIYALVLGLLDRASSHFERTMEESVNQSSDRSSRVSLLSFLIFELPAGLILLALGASKLYVLVVLLFLLVLRLSTSFGLRSQGRSIVLYRLRVTAVLILLAFPTCIGLFHHLR
jgi:hypothetical protein